MPEKNIPKQYTRTLSAEQGRTLLTELMHEGYDCDCSPKDQDGNLTITWPASVNIGKQLKM